MPLTLGTAGHIDHGKTALVRALTGVDTDRLPEEKRRGITIALGFAPLSLASGRVSVVDVPGHERFVRTMVAGATGIDLYLMVVAADDGVMPQTREHAAVLAALGVSVGVVAVTKADVADSARAVGEAAALLPGAEAVAVSTLTGAGVPELRAPPPLPDVAAIVAAATQPPSQTATPAVVVPQTTSSTAGSAAIPDSVPPAPTAATPASSPGPARAARAADCTSGTAALAVGGTASREPAGQAGDTANTRVTIRVVLPNSSRSPARNAG